MCMVWYPPLTGDFLLTASDHYKMKLYDSTSMMCRFVKKHRQSKHSMSLETASTCILTERPSLAHHTALLLRKRWSFPCQQTQRNITWLISQKTRSVSSSCWSSQGWCHYLWDGGVCPAGAPDSASGWEPLQVQRVDLPSVRSVCSQLLLWWPLCVHRRQLWLHCPVMGDKFKVRSNNTDNRWPLWPCFVNLSWLCDCSALEAAASLGGADMVPFYTMLEGGRDGNFYRVSKTISVTLLLFFLRFSFDTFSFIFNSNISYCYKVWECPSYFHFCWSFIVYIFCFTQIIYKYYLYILSVL